jgi:hypothetical protein
MTKFHQNFLSLLREPLSIFRLVTLYRTDRHLWSFDSIHSHCHDDVNSFSFQFLIFLRILGYREASRTSMTRSEIVSSSGTSPTWFDRELAS